jgi:hypothetical protein
MAVNDPLGMMDGVNRPFLSRSINDPKVRAKVLKKLAELNREISRVQIAGRQLERDVQSVQTPVHNPTEHRALQSKEALRNWILSLAESFGYVERMIGAGDWAKYQIMLGKAANLGVTRAEQDKAAP